jgi:hypothetical protein
MNKASWCRCGVVHARGAGLEVMRYLQSALLRGGIGSEELTVAATGVGVTGRERRDSAFGEARGALEFVPAETRRRSRSSDQHWLGNQAGPTRGGWRSAVGDR